MLLPIKKKISQFISQFNVYLLFLQLNYARYYLPKLFPDLKGRIIFIDDDSIVQGIITYTFMDKLGSKVP